MPAGLEPARADDLRREWVEHYYEDLWIHRPRQGLGGLSPLAAAEAAHRGDAVARAKLAAVVDFREQLGRRPSAHAALPGLSVRPAPPTAGARPPDDPDAVDPADLSCAAPWELAALDPATLDDHRLVDAVASAVGLRDDAITAPLATELLRRSVPIAGVAPGRRGLAAGAPGDGRRRSRRGPRLDRPRPAPGRSPGPRRSSTSGAPRSSRAPAGPTRRCAPIAPSSAPDAKGAAMALDAAETLIDNGHLDEARPLLHAARDLAQANGLPWTARRAQELLDGLG